MLRVYGMRLAMKSKSSEAQQGSALTTVLTALLPRRLRSSLWCQKQAVAGDFGRSAIVMSILISKWALPVALGICWIALIAWVIPSPYERYYSQFQRAELIGLTETEILVRFGKPHGIMDDGSAWNYQIGKDPGAVVLFTDGKVVDVSKWERWEK